MSKILVTLTLLCASLSAQIPKSFGAPTDDEHPSKDGPAVSTLNPVLQWNRILLAIVRTPGAQPATIHTTRSFALMHAAIYDAVNAIARTHAPYLVRLTGVPRHASQQAAGAAAAHEVLAALYPVFLCSLDDELQQSLTQIPDGKVKDEGILIGRTVADRILALRINDGANAQPILYVFGSAPGDYQSTPPNFPPQPQFTHWSRVTPFAFDHANQFRPGPPPALTSNTYSEALNEIKALRVAQTATLDRDLTTGQSARPF